MPVTIKRGEPQRTASLGSDLLEAQALVAAPAENVSDEDALAMAREALRELQLLKQQLASMGVDPAATAAATAAADAAGPALAGPAALAASQQLEETIQERDRERLHAAWALEPSLSIQIEPDQTDQQVLARRYARWQSTNQQGPPPDFPPRRFQINGVVVWIAVGRVVQVPASLAALHHATRTLPLLDVTPAGENRVGYWVGDNPFGV
jgi:hypothetical protein